MSEQAPLLGGDDAPDSPVDLFHGDGCDSEKHEAWEGDPGALPAVLGDTLRKFENVVIVVVGFVQVVTPLYQLGVRLARGFWRALKPFHPEEFLPAVYGLVLVFFGGAYMLTLAAIEAFRIFGWDKLKVNLVSLHENYCVALDASNADDLVDLDNDGIADVRQLASRRELYARKIRVVLKAIDPEEVSGALKGLAQGWFAVLATLRVRYAQAITLGVTIGEMGERMTGKLMRKALFLAMPDDYDKYVQVIVDYFWRFVGMWVAFALQRSISALYSSIRGAELFLWGTLTYLVRRKLLRGVTVRPGTFVFTALMSIIAAVGFWWQLTNLFQLPFPFNVIFFPLTILEWSLQLALVFFH